MSQIELNEIEKNKELVLEAFDTLFNRRDYIAAEHYWSPKYIYFYLKPLTPGIHNIKTAGACMSGRVQINVDIKLIVK
jgi:hypothetical protein